MKRFTSALILLTTVLSGCSLVGPQTVDLKKITSSPVANPFFNIPAENLKDYQDGTWILLAESQNKNWFYDPYSIYEDEEGIVSFKAFVTERGYDELLQPFNATSVGPYRQKIDCFSNYQWSEIYYADQMPKQETYVNPLKPTQEWGWIKIKPKTSMAYIRARVCGRKFIDDQNVNFFLYQQGRIPYQKGPVGPTKTVPPKDSAEAWISQFKVEAAQDETRVVEIPAKAGPNTPYFYDVINNEVKIIDSKKDIRQIKLVSYNMDKDFSKRGDFVFLANCQSKTYSLSGVGASAKTEVLSSSKEDLPNVAFNRVCGDHGVYMRLGSKNQ